MMDIKQYLEKTNTVLLTKEAFEYLKERARGSMTNEEAIKHVENMKKGVFLFHPNELYDTIINALEQEPCGDAISRQAVLDLAKKGFLVSNGNYESVCKAINDLPSVNPTKTGDLISKDKVINILDYWYDKDSDGYVQACKSISELQ